MAELDDAISAVEGHLRAADAQAWADALHAAADTETEWGGFVEALTQQARAAGLPDTAVTTFATVVGAQADPAGTVRRLRDIDRVTLAGNVRQRLDDPSAGTPAQPAAEPRALHWLTGPQQRTLHDGVGPDWPAALLDLMDERWPGWEAAEEPVRRQFVTDWTPTVLAAHPAPAAGPAAAGVRSLAWLTDVQHRTLHDGVGPDWPAALLDLMDERWPGWEGAEEPVRRQFVTDWTPTVLAAHPAPAGTAAAAAPPASSAHPGTPEQATTAGEIEHSVAAALAGQVARPDDVSTEEFTRLVAEVMQETVGRR